MLTDFLPYSYITILHFPLNQYTVTPLLKLPDIGNKLLGGGGVAYGYISLDVRYEINIWDTIKNIGK